MEGIIYLVIIGVLTLVILSLGMRIVPQGSKHVVERLGKYQITLGPGLNVIIPLIDRVAYKVPTKDIVLDIPSQEVITKDNVVIVANAVAYLNIKEPHKSVYGVEDYRIAIQNLVQTSLRSIVGEMSLDNAISSREEIKAKLKAGIYDDIEEWGIIMKTVEIQDINPSQTMQTAMEEQAAAERQRRATVIRAEGDKSATILEAEGRLEASRLDADATVLLADANQRAIEFISHSMKDNDLPAVFLLGEKYVAALRQLAASQNSKVIVLPADIPAAVRGIMNQLTK